MRTMSREFESQLEREVDRTFQRLLKAERSPEDRRIIETARDEIRGRGVSLQDAAEAVSWGFLRKAGW
jgi:hypothetical protein